MIILIRWPLWLGAAWFLQLFHDHGNRLLQLRVVACAPGLRVALVRATLEKLGIDSTHASIEPYYGDDEEFKTPDDVQIEGA